MMKSKNLTSLFILMLLFTLFIAPLTLAIVLYIKNPAYLHNKMLNKGQLITTSFNFYSLKISPLDKDINPKTQLHRHWLLLYLSSALENDPSYRKRVYGMHQIILALGKNCNKVKPIFIQIDQAKPLIKDYFRKKDGFLPFHFITSNEFQQFCIKVINKKACSGYYLIDPKGKIVLYYHPQVATKDLYQDLTHLLNS